MNQKKINEILREHKEWIETNGEKGSRTEFPGLVSRAYLRDVDFCETRGRWQNTKHKAL